MKLSKFTKLILLGLTPIAVKEGLTEDITYEEEVIDDTDGSLANYIITPHEGNAFEQPIGSGYKWLSQPWETEKREELPSQIQLDKVQINTLLNTVREYGNAVDLPQEDLQTLMGFYETYIPHNLLYHINYSVYIEAYEINGNTIIFPIHYTDEPPSQYEIPYVLMLLGTTAVWIALTVFEGFFQEAGKAMFDKLYEYLGFKTKDDDEDD